VSARAADAMMRVSDYHESYPTGSIRSIGITRILGF
jgi:hypothetical protein